MSNEQRANNEETAAEARTKQGGSAVEQRANKENIGVEPRANPEELSNEQLVIRIKAGEDMAGNMAQLYNQVRRFIHTIAWKYRDSGELEDLEQEGYLALYPAIEGYDPGKGIKFLTYAEYHIKQRIRRYLQMKGGSLRLPVYLQERQRQYSRLCQSFQMKYGREPSDVEAAGHLSVTLEQLGDIKKTVCMARLMSLDSPVTGLEGGEDATIGDMIASAEDMEGDAVERMQKEKLCAVLWSCVDALEPRQADVLRMRYRENKTLKEIGQECQITPEAVRQMYKKALRELRKPRYSRRLRPFLPEADRIYSIAITGNGVGKFNRTWTSSTERAALEVMDWEERRRDHLELLERVRQRLDGA